MARLLFSAPPEWWPLYREPLLRACADRGLEVALTDDPAEPTGFDYLIYRPGGPVTDFTRFANLKAVLSLWAGVERIAGDATLRVPLCRMVDESLTRGMVEWVTGHVLRYHLGIDAHLAGQDGVWRNAVVPPLATHRGVGLLGLGVLGTAVAEALAGFGFALQGWSRRPRAPGDFATHSGADGLATLLSRSEILVCLLPATPDTENLLDAGHLALLPRGARLINAGRGTLIDDDALLSALDAGHLAHATLDVFRQEPLPPGHAYWAHPRVTVTPHVAAETRPDTASQAIAENIRRGEAGLPLLHVVDRAHGY
ncbi:MAG: glyoxylate/hydroxypyruvate reductase A [Amaricoccus sp.]|uniref:2-hydroxyacid dehydrogenase n=1 Tax=Amaricoccus sp. TaxID=1872485 RepID=UPI003314D7EC